MLEIREAVLNDNLAAVKEPATWLAERTAPDGAPDTWNRWMGDLHASTEAAADAKDLKSAAQAVGQLGEACGARPTALGVTPTFTQSQPPQTASAVPIHMAVHHWAADRLWEGLIGPPDEAWRAGVAALQAEPLEVTSLLKEGVIADEIVALTKTVHAPIDEGPGRAQVVGTILAACADCHSKTRASTKAAPTDPPAEPPARPPG